MTKVDIFSGFLGAGKTTLIKKLIAEAWKGQKVVLIENEFGEVGVDGGFLKDSGIQITEMNSGCICCTLVGDFDKNLREVMEKFAPERILIEPSGVGKLSDVAASVIRLEKELDMELCGMATIVNAKKARKQMKAFGEFFNDQIAHATTVILSRPPNADAAEIEFATKAIQDLNPKAHVITTPWDDLDGTKIADVIEGADNLEAKALSELHHEEEEKEHEAEHHHHDHDGEDHEHHHDHDEHDHEEHEHHHDHDEDEHEHHHDADAEGHEHHHHHHADEIFDTWGIETPHVFEKSTIESMLKEFAEGTKYGEVIRAKGMVPVTEGGWVYYDLVDGEYELRDGAPDFTGRLVVIGQHLDEKAIIKGYGLEA